MSCDDLLLNDGACNVALFLQDNPGNKANKEFFRSNNCCGTGPDRVFGSRKNCCCFSFYNYADDITINQRDQTFATLCVFYVIAIFFLLFDLWKLFQSKKQKTLTEFIKSRKLLLLVASILSMISGIACSAAHYQTFRCAGASADYGRCPGGFGKNSDAASWLAAFLALDAVSNISFIASKMLALENVLRTVQIGLDRSPQAPSVRVLYFTVAFLCLCCLFYIIAAGHAANEQLEDFSKNTWIVINFTTAFVTFIFAMLSAALFIRHTTFHLNRYLNSLQNDLPGAVDAHESGNVELTTFGRLKMFARNSPMGAFVKNLSGSLRRLQWSVTLILVSFVFRACMYACLFSLASIGLQPPPTNSSYLDLSDVPVDSVCDNVKVKPEMIIFRSFLGSPLLIPLITLGADPLLMLCASRCTAFPAPPNSKIKPRTS